MVLVALLSHPVPAVEATVIKVKDGDTFAVRAEPWPGLEVSVSVRVRGIDTPEKSWRAKCPREIQLGAMASDAAAEMVPIGSRIYLTEISEGKYGGRVVAKVFLPDGSDYGQALVSLGLARPYDGGTKLSWCDNK